MNASLPRFLKSTLASNKAAPKTIGDILVASGRLSPKDAERIAERQKFDHSQFGDTAVKLKLLKKEDIDFALSKQFDYTYLNAKDGSLSPEVVAAHQPFSRAAENLRVVRSQLMLRWLHGDHDCKSLAVLSAGAKEGRSFVAANLAVVFAQHEERTLLIDGDLRGGRLNEIFKLPKGPGLSNVLSGRTTLQSAAMSVPHIPGLAVLPTGALPPNPQELLGRRDFESLLREAAANFNVIIIDTPAAELCADAEIIAARCNASVMVAQKDTSLLAKTAELAARLQQGGINLLGSVLNQA